jgi:hypothetical protein
MATKAHSQEAAMTPSINGYAEPSFRNKSRDGYDEPPFGVQLGVLMLCIVVLAILAAPIWLH